MKPIEIYSALDTSTCNLQHFMTGKRAQACSMERNIKQEKNWIDMSELTKRAKQASLPLVVLNPVTYSQVLTCLEKL